MKRAGFLSVILLIASPALAATYTWDGPTHGTWSAATNWVGDVAPDNDGTADIVFTNMATAGLNTDIDVPWSVNSLTQAGTAGQAFNVRSQPATGILSVGAGGIIGGLAGSPWMFFRPEVKFTTADSYIKNKMYFYSKVDSTFAGGTTVQLDLTDFRVDTLMSTTANVRYRLVNGEPALYGAGLNSLGPNKLFVTLTNVANNPALVRGVGMYGSSASNHLYFDTPIEFDAATIANGQRRFDINSQRSPTGLSLITHFTGNWTMSNGAKLTNTSGLGWLWLNGGGSAANTVAKNYYEQDSSTLVSDAAGDDAWSGDVFVYQGRHVINAAHAFKANNSAFFNIGGASGGSSTGSNYWLLATSGNHVNGKIRLTGGDSVGGTRRPVGTVGIEGTGTVEFNGKILLSRWAEADTLRVMNLALFAGPGGTAAFYGGIGVSTVNSATGVDGEVAVTGGGTVILDGVSTYTNRTTVGESTVFQLDGSMVSEIEVLAGSTLKGVGASSANVILRGDFAPGASIGTFTAYADVDFLGGSTLTIELGPGNTSDLLDAYADLDITGATLRLVGSDVGTFTIANYGSLTGTFSGIDTTGLSGGVTYDSINYGGKGDNTISLTVIPEPASFLLMASGLVAAWKLRRRA